MNINLAKMKKAELIAFVKKMEKPSEHKVIGELITLLDSLKVKDPTHYKHVVKSVEKVISDAKTKIDIETISVGYKKLVSKTKDKTVKVILNPETVWGKAFYKVCNKYAKKYDERLVASDKMDKETVEAFVVIATAFKDDIFSQIDQKEFDKITKSDKKYNLADYFEEDVFDENDEYSTLIVDWKQV